MLSGHVPLQGGVASVAPRALMGTLAGIRSMAHFADSSQQHDSQDLLACFLGGIHEDMNRIAHRRYIEVRVRTCIKLPQLAL